MFKPKLRFLHSADLHLDSPFKGLQGLPESIYKDIYKSTIVAFHRLVDLAINERVDFVLIVGDLFDHESSSIKSSLELKKGLERLNSQGIKAYISYGNHDFMMQEKAKLTFPQNTYTFSANGVSNTIHIKNGQPVAEISGFSYHEQAVTENMATNYYKASDTPYHIATLHGSLKSNQEHDHYAPFLIEDLKKVHADYWALGHIHKREVISQDPLAVYPGNIQGRHMKEVGEKGCYIVEMNGNRQPLLQFHSIQDIMFNEEEVAIEGVQKLSDVLDKLVQFKETLRKDRTRMIVRLTLHLSDVSLQTDDIEDILETLNETEENEHHWIWLNEIKVMEHYQMDHDELIKTNPFINEVLQTIEQTEHLSPYFEDLERHPIFRKHSTLNLDDIKSDIKLEAEELILRKLMKDR